MTHQISRRSLAKGAAWAAPAVLATATVPAYAASRCQPTLSFSGGLTYNWGTLGSSSTNQQLQLGGQTYVNNLPAGVTVTSISYTFWVQNRIGQTSSGPGAFYVGNTTSDRKTQTFTAMPWTPTAGSGFSSTASSTANLVNHTYSNGQTAQSWDLNMNWTAAQDTLKQYSTSGSCQNFTTGPSSKFIVNYTGVTGITSLNDPNRAILSDVTIKVTLSDGQVLTHVTNTTTTI